MDYRLLPVVRTQDLNDDYFELVLERKGLEFIPGDTVIVNNKDMTQQRPFFVASGIQEPWIRLLIKKTDSDVVNHLYTIPKKGNVKVKKDTFSVFPTLINTKRAIFIGESYGFNPFLSFFSTYPAYRPEKVIYGVNGSATVQQTVDWCKRTFGTLFENINAEDYSPGGLPKRCDVYICTKEQTSQVLIERFVDVGVKAKRIKSYAISE